MVTGVVIRAFAYHPNYRALKEIRQAAELVLAKLFEPDNYPDRKSREYWIRFPIWILRRTIPRSPRDWPGSSGSSSGMEPGI